MTNDTESGPVSVRATYLATEYRHENSSWGLYTLQGNDGRTFMACGNLEQSPIIGETLTLKGGWSRFDHKGKVFEFESCRSVAPRDAKYFVDYIASIGNIPRETAQLIVDVFGSDTLIVLSRSPDRMSEIHGLGDSHRERLLSNWRTHRQKDHLEDALDESGLNPELLVELSYRLPPDMTLQQMLADDPWLIYVYSNSAFYLVRDFVLSTGPIQTGHYLEAGIVGAARRALMQGKHSISIEAVKKMLPHLMSLKSPVAEADLTAALNWLEQEGLAETNGKDVVLTEVKESQEAILGRLEELKIAENEVTDQLTLEQLEKLISTDPELKSLKPRSKDLLSLLQSKAAVVHACHYSIESVFERLMDLLQSSLHFELTKISADHLAHGNPNHHSLRILQKQVFGPPSKGKHNPIEAEVILVFRAHLLTASDTRFLLDACEDEALIFFVGSLFSSPLHVPGAPMAYIRDVLPSINFDLVSSQLSERSFRQLHDLSAGNWKPTVDDSDLDFDLNLITLECSDEEIPETIHDLCFGDLVEALSLDSRKDSQIIVPVPRKQQTKQMYQQIESRYSQSFHQSWSDESINKGILRSGIPRLELPLYLVGRIQDTAKGKQLAVGTENFQLYPSESTHVGISYLVQIAHAQQVRVPMVVVPLHSAEKMTNEDLLCAINCSSHWTFLVGSTQNIASTDLREVYEL